jgi:predicted transcriptional regulator
MKAQLLLKERHQLRADAFVELRIWLAPKSVRGTVHPFKYALAYVVGGVCVALRQRGRERRSSACRRRRDRVPIYDAGSAAGRFLAGRRSMETEMNIVTLSIASREEVSRRAAAAFRGEEQGAHISFDTVDLLWNTLTRKRWEILRAMTGQGALSIREVARRVGRDVKAVHGDVTALLHAGILDQAEAGVVFPYDAVHVDFTLTNAA